MNRTDTTPPDMLDIVLTSEDAVDPNLQIPPSQRDFGTKPEVKQDNIEIRIGQRPLVRNIRTLYELAGREIPPDLEVFRSYKLWMLTHAVSVIKEPGKRDIRRLGFEVSFPPEPRVTVVEVFPQSRFVKKIGADVESSFVFEAGIDLHGQAAPPESITELLKEVEALSFGGKVEGKIGLSTKTNLVGRFSFAVMTPVIEAVGVGDDYSQWVFTKDTKSLVGDHLMAQTLLVPKNVSELRYKARVSATITTFHFLPDKRRSKWIELVISLPR